MQYTVTLYKNTGFNTVDIPDSPALLETFSQESVPALFLKQNGNITTIKIEHTYSQLESVDYCRVGDIYYYLMGINMLNNNVAELSLLEDSLTTLGGIDSIEILDGLCTRRCVSDDTLFSNKIPENFTPALPFELENYKFVSDYDYEESVNIVLSTCDLTSSDIYLAQVFVDEEESGIVTVPKLPPIAAESTIGIRCADGIILKTKYPNIGIFDFNDAIVQESITTLRSLGLESVIVGCYKIPKDFMYNYVRDAVYPGKIIELTTNYIEDFMKTVDTGVALSATYSSYVPKNNKVFSLFNSLQLYSVSSGDSVNYDMFDIHGGGDIISFTLNADPSKDGTPSCRPKFFEGQVSSSKTFFLNCVFGSNWINTPIAMRDPSGSAISYAEKRISELKDATNYNYQTAGGMFMPVVQKNRAIDRIGSISQLPGFIANAAASWLDPTISGLKGAITGDVRSLSKEANMSTYDYDYYNMMRDYQAKDLAYFTSQQVVAPTIIFPQAPTLQLYLGNTFYATTVRLNVADLERLDKYFTKYGYAVSEVLTKDFFSGRQNFNFVEAKGVTIISSSNLASRLRRISAASQIENGIRVWHVKPSNALMNNNPIV